LVLVAEDLDSVSVTAGERFVPWGFFVKVLVVLPKKDVMQSELQLARKRKKARRICYVLVLLEALARGLDKGMDVRFRST
jgi:hypothetical protein